MTQNQIITVTARKNMVRARAGEIQLPKIVGFVSVMAVWMKAGTLFLFRKQTAPSERNFSERSMTAIQWSAIQNASMNVR